MSTSTPGSPRIAVVGAGPGGLTCARVLQRHGVGVTVYDADAGVGARDQGGTLDMHADSGQIALEEAGLVAEFAAVARPQGQAKARLDKHGTAVASFEPEEGDTAAAEIDRGQLRALIAAHVDPGTVRWGHRLVDVTPLGDGAHRLEFANGAVAEVDLVIGADGGWSRVRPLLSDARPQYTGISFLDVHYDDVETRHPEIAALVGDGHVFAGGPDGRGLIVQRNSDHVRGYLAMRTELDWPDRAGVDLDDAGSVRRHLLDEFAGWAPELLRLITDNDGGFVNRAIHALPAPLAWESRRGVTLLGDAAHMMAPFGGFGANLAMLDGAELAVAIAEEAGVDDAVRRYERTMLPRSGTHAVGANGALQRFFSAAGADHAAPDHAEEHRRFEAAAADRRRDRVGTSPDGPGGRWSVSYRTPRGSQQVVLDLVVPGGGTALTGTFDGRPITGGTRDGAAVAFSAALRSPFPMTITCTASVEDGTMTGRLKAPMMTVPFTGSRIPQ
jgi:2-polyprenyl-6-methoxyphenol hydroxylase-like FAD-dependent oxidoreductase